MQFSPEFSHFFPLYVQISSSAPQSQISPTYFLSITSEIKFHNHSKQRQNYNFIYFSLYGKTEELWTEW